MGYSKLDVHVERDRAVLLFDPPPESFGLRFKSGPQETSTIAPGSWLTRWEPGSEKVRFAFGPQPGVAFSREGAEAVAKEMHAAVDVIVDVCQLGSGPARPW
jgi:hypothetical protein